MWIVYEAQFNIEHGVKKAKPGCRETSALAVTVAMKKNLCIFAIRAKG